jgi:oligopeptide/dipeptide ABC transporter ATP-binding protein
MLLSLEKPTAGQVTFEGFDVNAATREQLRRYRTGVQAVFQDPWSSLNPRMRVREIIAEPLLINGWSSAAIAEAVRQSLLDVGLEVDAGQNFPHEFSGGQRQRIAIARAVAPRPKAIVLDEPVSALDVSVRAQIMNLLKDLQAHLGMSYLLISHDLATVRFLADRVAVMYRGRIVEQGQSEHVFSTPRHPYTQRLIAAAGVRRPRDMAPAAASIPPNQPKSGDGRGCDFAPRCSRSSATCISKAPEFRRFEGEHLVACHWQ